MYYDINLILFLTKKFRNAIDKAHNNGDFNNDFSFDRFPHGCCGATCYVLAKYFKEKGIDSIYVCGLEYPQSHAWLVIKDDRVKKPSFKEPDVLEDFEIVFVGHNGETYNNLYMNEKYTDYKDVPPYQKSDLEEGIIVDITADQFGEEPVFVGHIDDFYKKYEFDFAHDSNYNLSPMDTNRYSIIKKYL